MCCFYHGTDKLLCFSYEGHNRPQGQGQSWGERSTISTGDFADGMLWSACFWFTSSVAAWCPPRCGVSSVRLTDFWFTSYVAAWCPPRCGVSSVRLTDFWFTSYVAAWCPPRCGVSSVRLTDFWFSVVVVMAYSGAPNKRHPDDKSPVDETINPGPPCAYTCAC